MLSENEKILLDYKSERKVKNHCLKMRFTVLSGNKKLFHILNRFVKNNISLQ